MRNLMLAALVMIVPSLLLGCSTVYEKAARVDCKQHKGFEIGDTISEAMAVRGIPMRERHLNPSSKLSLIENPAKDYTGWAWWKIDHSTAVGLRYEGGVCVERTYGFNHWSEAVIPR